MSEYLREFICALDDQPYLEGDPYHQYHKSHLTGKVVLFVEEAWV